MKLDSGSISIRSHAKINLFLQILSKRADGYHNLVTLICRVGLYDIVSISLDVDETTIICDDPNVPEDSTNLCYKAAVLFFSKLNKIRGKKHKGLKIFIQKNIPVAAGLGGGSSNAASVLLILNHYFGDPFTHDEIMDMGFLIGTDVPFFIFKKPAIASGIGEKLIRYTKILPFKVVLVCPKIIVSTTNIYNNLNLGLTKCKKKLKSFFKKRQNFNIEDHLCNDLEAVTEAKHPEILTAKEALLRHGALGVLMSGSGPSVFGLYLNFDKARKASQALSQNNIWQTFVTEIVV